MKGTIMNNGGPEQLNTSPELQKSLEFFNQFKDQLEDSEIKAIDFCQEIATAAINKEWLTKNMGNINNLLAQQVNLGLYMTRQDLPQGVSGDQLAIELIKLRAETIKTMEKSGINFYAPAKNDVWDQNKFVSEEKDWVWINKNPEQHNKIHSTKRPGVEYQGNVMQKSIIRKYIYATDVPPTQEDDTVSTPVQPALVKPIAQPIVETPIAQTPVQTKYPVIDYDDDLDAAANPRGRG